jgi:hypothetical protein
MLYSPLKRTLAMSQELQFRVVYVYNEIALLEGEYMLLKTKLV